MKSPRIWMAGLVLGALLFLAPVFGLLDTVFHMARAFQLLGTHGIPRPDALSHHIGGVLDGVAVGILLCPVGIALFTLSLIFYLQARNASVPPTQHSRPLV
jgi:biopolymer transport protein ExbB/TolQ